MTEYEKQALKASDEYREQLRKQAQEAVDQSNAAYADKLEEVQIEADDAIRHEQETALDALDTAAVEEAVMRQQVREAMANWGLTAAGTERAYLQAAQAAATRQSESAVRRRDTAVKALTEALHRTEQDIETARASAESNIVRKAEDEAWEQENKLLKSAWEAEDKAEAERIKAEQKAEAERIKEKEKAEKEASQAKKVTQWEKNVKEQNRRSALLQLLRNDRIVDDIYARAIEGGWSVEETLNKQEAWSKQNEKFTRAAHIYEDSGFDAVMKHLRERYPIDEVYEICDYLEIDRDRVVEWYKRGGQ